MGKLLPLNEQADSCYEIIKFRKSCSNPDGRFYTQVVVHKSGKEIFNDTVGVIVPYDSNYISISIFWEDAGLDRSKFKALGLYGQYSSGYNKVVFSGFSLTIFAEEDVIIQIKSN